MSLFMITGRILIAFGILSLISGIIAFFPVFSYKPWFVGWSVRIASPIWSGASAVIAGVLIALAQKQGTRMYLWEAGFTFAILNTVISPIQGALAIAALLLGPYCYYSFAGVSGTNYLGYAILFPFPYDKFASACKDPLNYAWYHLALQILDFSSALTIFCASLATVVKLAARLFHLGHLNVVNKEMGIENEDELFAAHQAKQLLLSLMGVIYIVPSFFCLPLVSLKET